MEYILRFYLNILDIKMDILHYTRRPQLLPSSSCPSSQLLNRILLSTLLLKPANFLYDVQTRNQKER